MCEEIEVEMCNSGFVKHPGIIRSGDLNPCIAIGIYDISTKTGYLIHEFSARMNQNIEPFIKKVLTKSNKENLKIKVIGGKADFSEGMEGEIENEREYVLNLLLQYFTSEQVEVEWNYTNKSVELVLYTENGKFDILEIES